MARKSVVDLKSSDKLIADAVATFESVSVVKYEMAKEAYDLQNAATKKAIDRMVDTLRLHANGYINVQLDPPRGALVPVKIGNEYLGYNLLYLAIEIAKDLAFVGLRIRDFKFPPSSCVRCGAELGIPEKVTVKR